MIVKGVEIIYKLLVVVHSNVGLSLLDVGNLLLVATELLLNLFYHTLIVLDLCLRVLVRDALGWVRRALLFLLGEACLLERRVHAGLYQLQDRRHLRVHRGEFAERVEVDLCLLARIDVTQVGQSLQFVLNLGHLCA